MMHPLERKQLLRAAWTQSLSVQRCLSVLVADAERTYRDNPNDEAAIMMIVANENVQDVVSTLWALIGMVDTAIPISTGVDGGGAAK